MLKEILDTYAGLLNKDWGHDRSKTVGASEIGQCARKTFWVKNKDTTKGVPMDDDWADQWGARIRGTIMENAFWEPAMKTRFGDDLLFSGKQQKTFKSGYLSATPDGLVINQPPDALKSLGIKDTLSDCFMVECKTIDPRTNLVEAKTENYFQVQVQLGLIREQTEYQPVYDVLTYSDASFWSEVSEFPIEYEPAIYEAAKSRATIIMIADSGSDLAPEGWIAGGKECSFCPFVKACGVERRSVPRNSKNATPQLIAEITEYALQANQVQATLLQQNARLKELQHTIKSTLREKSVRRIDKVVNWYEVAGATRYNQEKMKEHLTMLGEDMDQFIEVGEPSDRLTIYPIPTNAPAVVKMIPPTLKAAKPAKKGGKKIAKKKIVKRKAA